METEHFFLDLPAFADALGTWLQSKSGQWRPNVLKFSLNLLDDLKPRAVTRDLDWGVPVPLDGWRDRPDKRIYVWFDAVIGYLSASIEWARRSGDPDAWRAWWQSPDAESYYFMGKDNIVFHAEIWPAMLLGYGGQGAKGGTPGSLGALNLPTDVVASEYLTMEGRKFSSSRSVVIYVRDFLERYDVDALRYYLAVAGPENQDTDFTWSEFIRRNNDELLANWGNLVNRTVSFAARNIGSVPEPGALTDADRQLLQRSQRRVRSVGDALSRSRFKAAITETMRTLAEANKYLSEQAPWKLRESDPERMRTDLPRGAAARRRRQDAADPVPAALVAAGLRDARRVRQLVGDAADRGGQRGRRPRVPGDHRRLRTARRGGSPRRSARARRWQPPDAAVHQARPRPGRRGAGPAGAGVTAAVIPAGRRRSAAATRAAPGRGVRQPHATST